MNVPDLTPEEFSRRRKIEVGKFSAWLVVTVVAGTFHPVLWIIGIVIGWFIVDTGTFTTYEKSRRELEWARTVIAKNAENDPSVLDAL